MPVYDDGIRANIGILVDTEEGQRAEGLEEAL